MSEELEGAELDAAVAELLGWRFVDEPTGDYGMGYWRDPEGRYTGNGLKGKFSLFHYSSDWADGGPIIEAKQIALDCWPGRAAQYRWRAAISSTTVNACEYGPTALVAAMRAFVSSKESP